jgi:very-short-patch-repair endonuclease
MISMARSLRRRSTDAERRLWDHLRVKQVDGLKFRRQEPIDGYIVDFVCYECRVIVEADGGQHDMSECDERRDEYLKTQGFVVLRFWNTDILTNMQGVMTVIQSTCRERRPPPAPPVEGGG